MRSSRSPITTALYLVAVISLLVSGMVVSAAPVHANVNGGYVPLTGCKTISHTSDRSEKPVVAPSISCCYDKVSLPSSTDKTVTTLEDAIDPCCYGKPALDAKRVIPCAPTPAPTCPIAYTDGAVVGDLPFDTQAYWAPGKPALKVTLNKGTYWVFGVATAEDGAEYYQILVSCQKLYVPIEAMQPSYVAPWHGEPLPTTPVE